jgi:hypothetical protein
MTPTTIIILIVAVLWAVIAYEILVQTVIPALGRIWNATPRWVVWAVGIVLWGVFLWTC